MFMMNLNFFGCPAKFTLSTKDSKSLLSLLPPFCTSYVMYIFFTKFHILLTLVVAPPSPKTRSFEFERRKLVLIPLSCRMLSGTPSLRWNGRINVPPLYPPGHTKRRSNAPKCDVSIYESVVRGHRQETYAMNNTLILVSRHTAKL